MRFVRSCSSYPCGSATTQYSRTRAVNATENFPRAISPPHSAPPAFQPTPRGQSPSPLPAVPTNALSWRQKTGRHGARLTPTRHQQRARATGLITVAANWPRYSKTRFSSPEPLGRPGLPAFHSSLVPGSSPIEAGFGSRLCEKAQAASPPQP